MPVLTKPFPACLLLVVCLTLNLPSALPAETADAGPVKVYHELNSDDSYSIFADNGMIIPCYVRVDFSTCLLYTSRRG